VAASDDFAATLESARREAQSSFANDEVLLERHVGRPRHVEVQIFGDAHGNVIHLGERECSIQRRHQKLVEESPSPVVDAELRERIGEAAVSLARAAGYQGAGTVEFLLDEDGSFYFLELNARLQVEHPVTEMVTGLDLVQLQIQVANDQPLPLSQNDVQIRGHAIEARIIAEDPSSGFLPSTGVITAWSLPESGESIRVDSGFEVGSEITPYYDSLLAKLIVWGDDRSRAVKLLRDALDESAIVGPSTNLDLLLAIAEHPAFERGELHTGFLDEHQVVASLRNVPAEVFAAASVANLAHMHDTADPWQARTGWRAGGVARNALWQTATGMQGCAVTILPGSESLSVRVNDEEIRATLTPAGALEIAGGEASVRHGADGRIRVRWQGRSYHLTPAGPPEVGRHGSATGESDGAVIAPMPGRVVKVTAAPGDTVTEHQPLLVLESMKIEHVVTAPISGTIRQLHTSQGAQVISGEALATIEPPS
jgi:acetyl/propionyl-CoA carboxylase alpha subunit